MNLPNKSEVAGVENTTAPESLLVIVLTSRVTLVTVLATIVSIFVSLGQPRTAVTLGLVLLALGIGLVVGHTVTLLGTHR